MGHIYAKAADSIYETFFFKSKKIYIFYNPHHSDKKRKTTDEFLTDFVFFFTFVIRITQGCILYPRFVHAAPPRTKSVGMLPVFISIKRAVLP